jgi:hypothetical protein
MLGRIVALGAFLLLTVGGARAQAAMITGGTDINVNNGYQCVEVAGGGTKPGTAIQSWDCWAGFNQEWHFFHGQILGIGSEINAQGATSNLTCMDLTGTSAGSGVVLNTCNGSATQQWIVKSGRIESAAAHMCLDLGAGYSTSGVQVTISPCGASMSQQFAIR